MTFRTTTVLITRHRSGHDTSTHHSIPTFPLCVVVALHGEYLRSTPPHPAATYAASKTHTKTQATHTTTSSTLPRVLHAARMGLAAQKTRAPPGYTICCVRDNLKQVGRHTTRIVERG